MTAFFSTVYNWTCWLCAVAVVLDALVFLPLSCWRRARSVTGPLIMATAWVFWITTWMWCIDIVYELLGIGWVIGSLLFAGVGVVPVALATLLFKGMWGILGLVLLAICICAFTAWVGHRISEAGQSAVKIE